MIVYSICYLASYLFARCGQDSLAGVTLILAAVYLYSYDYRRTGNLLHLRGLLSVSWTGGQGIAALQLSRLQTDWQLETWACFFLAQAAFWLTFEALDRTMGEHVLGRPGKAWQKPAARPLYYCILGLSALWLTAFLIEAVYLGYLPLFMQGVPHAYSEFHVRGIHYFTVSCVLTPSLAVLYFLEGGSKSSRKNFTVTLLAVLSLVVPILCVSRFQLIFAVLAALFTYIAYTGRVKISTVISLAAALIPLYVLLTVARSHDVEYLNGIFEMKNEATPIFISQPYIYVANNYENFNCLVEALPAHTYGLRMLFPLWTLTGLKFFFPELVYFPIYIDKTELTTLTLFYDAYYDFGLLGVAAFSVLLGAAAFWLVNHLGRFKNPVSYMLYAQIAVYMALAFFTTWFSNPTTWFYLAGTGIMAFYCYRAAGDREI